MNKLRTPFLQLSLAALLCTTRFASTDVDLANTNATLQEKQLIFNGDVSTVYGAAVNSTTYMPIWYVMQALNHAGFTNTWTNGTWNITLPQNWPVDLNQLSTGSGDTDIELNGQSVQEVNAIALNDPYSHQPTTYMPIWYVMQVLNRAGVTSSWNGTQWTMTWATTTRTNLQKLIFLDDDAQGIADVQSNYPSATALAPSAYAVTADGSLSGYGTNNSVSFSHANGKTVSARFELSNASTLSALLGNVNKREALVNEIAEKVSQENDDSVNIDFESMPVADRSNFVSFLSDLHTALGAMDKTLSVDLPAVTNNTSDTWDRGYDFSAIGQVADSVVIMAYDYSYPTSSPGPIAPESWVSQSLAFATSRIPSSKILLGLDTYAYDWGVGNASALSLNAADAYMSSHAVNANWNTVALAPYYTYQIGSVTHTVYYETPQSLDAKLNLVTEYHLGGIAVWRAGLEDSATASTINQFQP